jgi:uncharacterized membrane protein YebE (DUF533 family)
MDGESPDTSEKENKSSAKKRSTKAKEVTSSLSDEDSLLFWGSVCVASKDSELLDNELETIMSLSSSEEAVVILNRLKLNNDPYKEAYKQLKLNMKNYINLAQPIKCGILQKLILVARADGQVTDTEKEILESICQEVGIPSAFYGKILSYL